MSSHTHYLWFNTRQRQEIIDITDQVTEQVGISGVKEGMETGEDNAAAHLRSLTIGQRRKRVIMKVLGEP